MPVRFSSAYSTGGAGLRLEAKGPLVSTLPVGKGAQAQGAGQCVSYSGNQRHERAQNKGGRGSKG